VWKNSTAAFAIFSFTVSLSSKPVAGLLAGLNGVVCPSRDPTTEVMSTGRVNVADAQNCVAELLLRTALSVEPRTVPLAV
jgi:hypothetical protein